MKKIDALRKKYPEFVYQEFEWKYLKPNLKIWFNFLIRSIHGSDRDLKFKTQITIKKVSNKHLDNINKRDLDNLVLHLGLIEMLNYWKLTCSPKILIDTGNLYKEEEVILVERKLDPLLLKLNKSRKFLNGHVPFSAFLAYLSLIAAMLFNYGKIAFSWEKSANEPNLKYKGRWINHQWSKSSKFEKEFNSLTKKYLLKNVNVFSALRKFSELEIAQIFARLKKYHSAFLSCNNAYKISTKKPKWCLKCPKCLFVFSVLYPFLEEKDLIKIFGKNIFEDRSLLPLMLKLVGKKESKPFECVGTKKETILAFSLALRQAKERKKIPFLLKKFEELHIKK